MSKTKLVGMSLAFVALLAGVVTTFAVVDSPTNEDRPAFNLGSLRTTLGEMPLASLSEQEWTGVQATRVGTKLSRDLYIAFDYTWKVPAFATNMFNERVHMDAAGLLLTRYAVADPTAGRAEGSFRDPVIQALHRRFRQEGMASEDAAIRVMMRLEELDIQDLKTRSAQTDKEDLQLVYRNLLRGNALNLWDLAAALRENDSLPYEPEFLSQAELREIVRRRPDDLGEDSLLLRARVERCGKRDIRAFVSREVSPAAENQAASLRQRACSTQITLAGAPSRSVRIASKNYQLKLLPTSMAIFPGTADSNSPAVWEDNKLLVFNSWDEALRSTGDEVSNLADPVEVQLPSTQRPGHVWLESIWRDPASGTYFGWYHLEPGDLPCSPLTAPIIGAAVSTDGGLTWQDRGPVLEAAYAPDCDYRNGYFVGGHGDFSVVLGPRREYFYFLFSNYAGPVEEQGVAVARSRVADRGQPGSATKYRQGAWSEPGIGGKVTPLVPSSTGWKGPYVEAYWGPSVHWNNYLQCYVMLLNHTATGDENWAQEGIYISFSTDLVAWSKPEKILETNNWYPQVMGLSAAGTDNLAERFMRIYVGGVSTFILEFATQG